MLKPIPVEEENKQKSQKKIRRQKHTAKNFIPHIENGQTHHDDHFFKNICVHFVNFINRGTRYTIQQIDELVMGLQKSILRLQKKKHQLLEKERDKMRNVPPVRFKKRKIT